MQRLEAAAAGPAEPPRLAVIAAARRTERIAVPIEAPPWRMMFIAVEVRAIAAGGTACIAAVIVGIIEKPMPEAEDEAEAAEQHVGGGRR